MLKKTVSLLLTIALFFGVLTCAPVIASAATTVYFVNSLNWSDVYGYAWTNGGEMAWPGSAATLVDSANRIYSYDTGSYTNVIFNNNNNGSQTQSLDVQPGKYYEPKTRAWYDTKVAALAALGSAGAYEWYVCGTIGGNGWTLAQASMGMTKQSDGSYTKTFENVAAGTYEYKVNDGTWDRAYPGSNKTFTVANSGSTVTIKLSGTTVSETVTYSDTSSDWKDNGLDSFIQDLKVGDTFTYSYNVHPYGGVVGIRSITYFPSECLRIKSLKSNSDFFNVTTNSTLSNQAVVLWDNSENVIFSGYEKLFDIEFEKIKDIDSPYLYTDVDSILSVDWSIMEFSSPPFDYQELINNNLYSEGYFDLEKNIKKLITRSISVDLLDSENKKITSGYSVKWYEKGSDKVIATGRKLNGIDKNKNYQYEIVLGEELSYLYKQPPRQDAIIENDNYELSYKLEPLNKVTVNGQVADNGVPVKNATVLFEQEFNGQYSKTVTAATNENGYYSAEIANVPTSISVEADGYYSSSKTIITKQADGDTLNVDAIELEKLPDSKVSVSIFKTPAVKQGETAEASEIKSFKGLSFSIYNKTKGSDITGFKTKYPNIVLGDEADADDEIEISVNDTSNTSTAEKTKFTLDNQRKASCRIDLTENGKFSVNSVSGNEKNTVFVFDADGKNVSSSSVDNGFVSDPLKSGNYTLVFIKSSSLLGKLSNISKLNELGLKETKDYVKKSVSINNGVVEVIDSVEIPALDETKLYYTVDENTNFTANISDVAVGKYIQLKCEYEVDKKYSSSNQQVRIELPSNIQPVGSSVTVDKVKSPYTYEDNVVSINTNKSKCVIRMYVVPTSEGKTSISAYLSMNIGGESIVQTLGSPEFKVEKNNITVPNKVTRKNVTVSGSTMANSDVTVYDNEVEVGKVNSNANGKWSCTFNLNSPGDYSKHEIYAVINNQYVSNIKTETETLIYDKTHIELSKITMINSASGFNSNECVSVFDFINPSKTAPSFTYNPSYPTFTFKVEFTSGDDTTIKNVNVITKGRYGSIIRIPVKYDPLKQLWLGLYVFNSSTAPASVSASYEFVDQYESAQGVAGEQAVEVKDCSYKPNDNSEEAPAVDEQSNFGVTSVDRAVGAPGEVTLGIKGNLMTSNLTASLKKGNNEIKASDIYWINHSFAYATFNLSTSDEGQYSLEVKDNNKTATLSNCFKLDKSLSAGKAEIKVNIADNIKTGEEYKGSITVTNSGYSDIYAPILVLKGNNLQFKTTGDYASEASVFVKNSEGLSGVIRKGETASLNFTYKSTSSSSYSLEAREFAGNRGFSMNDTTLSESSSADDVVKYNLAKLTGETNFDFSQKIAKTANLNDSLGSGDYDIASLYVNNAINATGSLGFTELASSDDVATSSLSFGRTYYGSINGRYTKGEMGYGWFRDNDITAEHKSTDSGEGIIVKSPNDSMIFVKQDGVYKYILSDDITASYENKKVTLTSSNGVITEFNEEGKLSQIKDKYNGWIKYEYRDDGLLKTVSNNNGEKLSLSYLSGKLNEVTSSNGDSAEYSYDGDYLTSVKTKYGTIKYSYDKKSVGGKRHSLVKIENDNGAFIKYSYDELGRVIKIEDNESYTNYVYGSQNDITVTDSDNKVSHYFFDSDGKVVKTIDNEGKVISTFSDSESSGCNIGLSDSLKYSYNKKGEMTSVTDLDGKSISYGYNDKGFITSLTDKGGVSTAYNRDDDGNLTSIKYADNSEEKYTYNEKGNIATFTKKDGVVITYTYDSKERVIKEEYSSGEVTEYTYNSRDNITSIKENDELTTLSYNEKGDVSKITYPSGKSIIYTYDDCGRTTSVADSDGNAARYTYDVFDRLAETHDASGSLICKYAYNSDSSISRKTNGNGTYTDYSYDNGRLNKIKNCRADKSVISEFTYSYNTYGLISSMTDSKGEWKYSYDKAGQLTKVVEPGGDTTEYAYDLSGNRTSVKKNGSETAYTSNSLNQYTSVGGDSLTYDANGNLTKVGSKESYEYDSYDRLIKFTSADSKVYKYTYDAFGNRNSVTVDGEKTECLVDPSGYGNVIAEYGKNGTKQYVQANGLAAQISGGNTYYYNFNQLGSTSEITDSSANTVNSYSYDAEGKVTDRTEEVSNPFTYVGAYGIADDNNGLYYMRARYTSQRTSSFITPDPAGQTYDTNMYRYASNNTVNCVDVSGECAAAVPPLLIVLGAVGLCVMGLISVTSTQQYSYNVSFSDIYTTKNIHDFSRSLDPIYNIYKVTSLIIYRDIININSRNSGSTNSGSQSTGGDPNRNKKDKNDKDKKDIDNNHNKTNDEESIFDSWKKSWKKNKSSNTEEPNNPTETSEELENAEKSYEKLKKYLEEESGPKPKIDFFASIFIPPAMADEVDPSYLPVNAVIDPSGYVYEAVPSNRLEGVKAEAYYYDYALDEFGMPEEKKSDILWNAEDYDQENPVYTDANGRYSWDVPEGRWLVKFSKDGYYDADSKYDIAADEDGYLPVPPPQTDVNVAMVSKAAPEIKGISVYKNEVDITFTQYMNIKSVSGDNVTVKMNGTEVSGKFTPSNAEYDYKQENQYASEFKFVPDSSLSGTVTVVADKVKNYAGTQMNSRTAISHQVQAKPESIIAEEKVDVDYNSAKVIELKVNPADAGALKTLTVTNSSPSIVSVANEKLTTDENGTANLVVSGDLPGEAELTVALDGTDITKSIRVSVGEVTDISNSCAIVNSSVKSGSTLEKSSMVSLSCDTEGATIYYTTDGSSPTDKSNTSRKAYLAPISVESDMTLLAYAEKDGKDNSDISVFVYNIKRAPSLEGMVNISGDAKVGGTLSADVSLTVGESDKLKYQWYADDVAIDGADSQNYTVAQSDAEKEIKVIVSSKTEDFTGKLSSVIYIEKPEETTPTDPSSDTSTEPTSQVSSETQPTESSSQKTPTTPVKPKTAKISKTKAKLKSGKTLTLKVTNAKVKSWKSSNTKVATVKNGKVTALRKGTITITAALKTGKTLKCKVTVTSSPKLSKNSVTVKKGKTASVKITGKAKTVKNKYTKTKFAKIISKKTASTIKVKGLKKGKTTLKIKVNGVLLKLKVKVK